MKNLPEDVENEIQERVIERVREIGIHDIPQNSDDHMLLVAREIAKNEIELVIFRDDVIERIMPWYKKGTTRVASTTTNSRVEELADKYGRKMVEWFRPPGLELFVVVFCPCHGYTDIDGCTREKHRWGASEWWGTERDNAYKNKRPDIRYFDTPEEGIEFYRNRIVDGPRVSRYDSSTDSYDGDDNPNVTITGSHTVCDKCKEARDAKRERGSRSTSSV
jgi:hypothetical protein